MNGLGAMLDRIGRMDLSCHPVPTFQWGEAKGKVLSEAFVHVVD